MVQVIINPDAEADLKSIKAYISRKSVFNAESFISQLLNQTKLIANNPEAGGVVLEIGLLEVRQRLYKKYRIIYLITDESIEVLTFHHSSRLLKNNPYLKDYTE